MERIHLLPVFLICCIAVAGCAGPFEVSKSYNVTYDMAHNDMAVFPPGGFAVSEGDLVSFEVRNVNPFLYDVSINNKSIAYATEAPAPGEFTFREETLVDTVFQPGTLNTDIGGSVNRVPISRFRTLYSIFRGRYTTFYSFLTFDDYIRAQIRQPFPDEKLLKEGIANRLRDVAGQTMLYTRSDFIRKGDEMFEGLTKSYNDLSSEYHFLDSLSRTELRDVYGSAKGAYDGIANRGNWALKIGRTADLYEMVQNTPFSFSSFKIQVDGGDDEMKFNINGRRKNADYLPPSYDVRPFDLEYGVKVRGGWRIDFSGGLMASSLVDHSFNLRDSLGFKSIIQNDPDAINYGPGALMHFYHKSFMLGGNLGVMLNNSSRLQYLVGGSVLLGDHQRLCLNGGMTFGQANRLAAGYETDQILIGANANLITPPVVEKLDIGWYAGISYNFTASRQNQ